MAETRIGRQTPTAAVVLPYTQTLGGEAIEAYNRSGREALEWQQLLIYDIMALNADGLWTHMKMGWSIPRRNGKSEVLIIRAIYALPHGERVLYTAHRTTTSHNAWEKIIERLAKMGYTEGEDFKTTKQFGLERIEWLTSEGCINFRTRSSKGGLGEGYDLLIIDEAQEYTDDQQSALKYVVTDSRNPQTLMCGTPPTAVSSGTVFTKLREDVLSGNSEDSGWVEWSVNQLSDTHDPELWYETNPSLGVILTDRTVRSELGSDPKSLDDNIQRLGLWVRYNQKSAITRKEWQEAKIEGKPKLKPGLYYGVKYAKTSGLMSLAVAAKMTDGRIFVEAVDCRPVRHGNAWLMPYFANPHTKGVAIDGASGQTILAGEMKSAGIKRKPVLPKVAEIIEANSLFEKQLFSGGIAHAGQPSLEQIAANCEHRPIGSSGGFGYTSILEGADVSLLEAVSLAHWLAAIAKDKKPQKISY